MSILIVYPQGNALNTRGGAEARIWNIVSTLVHNNFKVSILHAKKSEGHEDNELKKECNVFYYKDLYYFGFPDTYLSDLNPFFIIKLFQIIKKHKFKVIQIEFPWGFLIAKLLARKNSILIYDSLGVESEFIDLVMKNQSFPIILRPIVKCLVKIYERLICHLATIIINVSDLDREFYIQKYKINKNKTIQIQISSAVKVENIERTEKLKQKCREKLGLPKDKVIVLFHGSLPHPSNQEAFDLIENYIAPKINYPDLLFVVAGYNVKKFVKNNYISLGYVKDLKDLLYSADFGIIPIISGSGIRVKCADYIISGLPFIITKKGIEGINFLRNGIDCLIYDNVDEKFIDGIKSLYKDKELRLKIQKNLKEKSHLLDSKKIENRFVKLYTKMINR